MAKEYNMLYKHADGNNLILENTADDKIEKVNLDAEAVIDNTVAAGKNILDVFTNFLPEFGGITSTISEDGYITATGVPESDYVPIVDYTTITDLLEDGATYRLSMTNNNSYMWCEVTALQNGTNKAWYSSRNSASFTVDKSTYSYRFRILTTTVSAWGSSSRTITSAFQLEKNSTVTEYEPYSITTREPSPTNPTEIKVLEKDIDIRFTTRNLLYKKTGTYTSNGITFTCNEDGSVTANGTASANATLYWYSASYVNPELPKGSYTLSGCPAGGSDSTYHIRIIKHDPTGYNTYYKDYGQGKDFTIQDDSKISCLILISSGQTVNNLTFYPQITVKGTRNLFNAHTADFSGGQNANYTILDYNEVKVTDTGSWARKNCVVSGLEPNTTYTISANKTATDNGVSSGFYIDSSFDENAINKTDGLIYKTFTSGSDGTKTIQFYVNWSSTVHNNEVSYSNIQIEKGDTIHDYVPGYTPGNQQNIELKFGVDNLWEFTEDRYYQSGNATYEIIDHNTLKVATTSSGTYRNVKFKLDIPDGTYTFSLGSITNSNPNMTGSRVEISHYVGSTRTIIYNFNPTTPKTITIENQEGRQYVLEFWATLGTAMENEATFSNIQVERSSVAHSFSDCNDTPIFLGTLNDLKNKIYYKDGKWYYSQEIGKVILSSENIKNKVEISNSKYGVGFNFNNSLQGDSTLVGTMLCNRLVNRTRSSVYNGNEGIGACAPNSTYYGTGCFIYIAELSSLTVDEIKAWLGQNETIVYYQLATPSVTEITNETLLSQLNTLRNATTYEDYTTVKFLDGATKEIIKSGLISFDYSLNNSNEYFQALIDNTATIETIVNVLPLNEGEEVINLNEENSVINWTHSDFRYVQNTEDKSQEGFIGQFVARTFDGKVIDLDDDFNIENHEIEVYLGIVNEEEVGYISLGNFMIESIERDEVDDTTSFKSSDYTMFFNQKFNGDYTDGTFTQSFNERIQNGVATTALWLAQYVCAQVGVELGHTDFVNNDYVLDSNQFDDQHTCRDVAKAIAKLAYSWARIGWDNKLYFDFTVDNEINTTLNSIDNDHYYNLETQKEEYGVINKVIVGSSIVSGNNQYIEDETSIEENGEHEIVIYDNPITYNDETKTRALEQGNVLYGLHYRPLSVTTTGHPWLQGNELIEIIDMEGNSIYTYPFDRVIEYNGHIKTKLDSYGATEVEATYTYEGTDNVNRQTKVELDRQNQRLTVAISELTGEIQDVSDEFNNLVGISKTAEGNPVYISDAGEFFVHNIEFRGNTIQNGTPTITNKVDIENVTGEHTFTISSVNLLNVPNDKREFYGINWDFNDNIMTYNGANTSEGALSFNTDRFELKAGTYTISYHTDGLIEDIITGDVRATTVFDLYWKDKESTEYYDNHCSFYDLRTNPTGNYTFTLDTDSYLELHWTISKNAAFEDYTINIQIEEGTEVTPYSNKYVEPQEFIWDLGNIELCKIGDTYDYINYNTTDEKWYMTKYIHKTLFKDIFTANPGIDTDEYIFRMGNPCRDTGAAVEFIEALDSQHPCYSEYFEYKGEFSEEAVATNGAGIYRSNSYGVYLVALKSDFPTQSDLSTWLNNTETYLYYRLLNSTTEEVQSYDTIVDLQEILDKAKLYETNMIIKDKQNISGTVGDMKITYLIDTEFNGAYATRTELQVTQNSISSVVADTVSTTLDPITLGLEDLGDRINTVEGNLQGDIDELRGDLGDYALQTDVVTLERSVTELQTSTAEVISVAKSIQLNGIERVRTSTDYTFDENGLSIGKTGAATKTQVTENGMSIYSTAGSTDEAMLTVNSQGVDAYNVKVGTYLLIGSHARMQDYEDGTGVFYIG